jgi:uncharacterized UBP type Zn finger protein
VQSENPDRDSTYKLAALIEHVGMTPHSGHYIAYKRLFAESINRIDRKQSDKWVKVNDEILTIITEEQILSRQRGAYLLFY